MRQSAKSCRMDANGVFSSEEVDTLTHTALAHRLARVRVPQGIFRVCVQVEREFDNVRHLKGADGQTVELEIDPTYNPSQLAREWGTVVLPPLVGGEHFEKMEGVPQELRSGDKVYFHFHAITPEYRYEVDGHAFYLIPYSMCYCVVRGGQILPLGRYLLTHPVDLGDSARVTKSNIVVSLAGKIRSTQQAVIAHVPAPKRGVPSELHPGQTVVFLEHADLPLTVEGTEYFIMQTGEIIGTCPTI